MHALIVALSVWVILLTAALYACAWANWAHFRRADKPDLSGELPAMTIIKPVRDLDDTLIPGLDAIVRADQKGRCQILIAMESEQDPAFAACRQFIAERPEREIEIVVTGPARGRMGKIHNMIEALPRAKHPYLVFSDADVMIAPETLAETGFAFRKGFNAVYALPYSSRTGDLSGYLMQIAFGHGFSVAAALGYRVGRFHFYAGAWMGYTKEMIAEIGGLAPFARRIADDFAIGDAASKAGSRKYLLHSRVGVRENDRTLGDSLRHLAKWSAIIRSCLPIFYAFLPLIDGAFVACVVLILSALAGRATTPALCLLIFAAVSRVATGLFQDWALGETLMSWPAYLGLPIADLLNILLWPFGFRSTVLWRGTRYKLSSGGDAVVL